MSNPFTLGALTELSKKSNMTSLGDGEMKVIHYVDLSSSGPFRDVEVDTIVLKTGTGTWAAGELAEVYIAFAEDAAGTFTDSIDETSDADQASKLDQCVLAGTVELAAASTTYEIKGFSVAQKLGRSTMPRHVVILLKNASSTATEDLSSTAGDHTAQGNTVAFA